MQVARCQALRSSWQDGNTCCHTEAERNDRKTSSSGSCPGIPSCRHGGRRGLAPGAPLGAVRMCTRQPGLCPATQAQLTW